MSSTGPVVEAVAKSRSQEPPGGPIPGRVGSWIIPAPEGAYGPVVAWTSGEAWFDAVMDALATPAGEVMRRRRSVAAGTFLRVARADWSTADSITGRNVATSHETVASRLGMSSKTAQRARDLMQDLGFAVTIEGGRPLYTHERAAARSQHGGHQWKAASTRALTMPRPGSVENVHLPRKGDLVKQSSVKKPQQARAGAREATALRSRAWTKKVSRGRQGSVRSPRPIELQRFAGQLAARMPWLARGRHVGAVCSMLGRAGVDPARWTVDALLDAIARANVANGTIVPPPAAQRDPIGYLAWSIGRSIDPADQTPTELAREALERGRAERAQLAQQRSATQAPDADEVARIDRIIEQMKVDAGGQPRALPPRVLPGARWKDQLMAQGPAARITQAILGAGGRRHDFDAYTQDRLDFALRVNGLLTWRGWTLDPTLLDAELMSWTWEPSTVEGLLDEHEMATVVTLNVEGMSIDVARAGEPWEQTEHLDWTGLETGLAGLETYRHTPLPE